IVGYPLFQSAVVEIDCATPAVTLYDPASYKLRTNGTWQRLVIDNFHPLVEARYEGDRSGWFVVGTGGTDTVCFHTPTVRKHKLVEGRDTKLAFHGGIGGMSRAKSGKLEWFELGGHRFDNPTVTFAESEKGAFANEYAEGNLGQAFFR